MSSNKKLPAIPVGGLPTLPVSGPPALSVGGGPALPVGGRPGHIEASTRATNSLSPEHDSNSEHDQFNGDALRLALLQPEDHSDTLLLEEKDKTKSQETRKTSPTTSISCIIAE